MRLGQAARAAYAARVQGRVWLQNCLFRPLESGAAPGGAGGDRGFALLLVLWSMALLALLATQVTAAGRSELRLSSALKMRAALQSAADAAVYETVWHMLSGPDAWPPEGGRRILPEAGLDVDVTVIDQRGKIDFNAVPENVLVALFSVLGTGRRDAQNLGDRITEWRTGSLPQDDVGQVRALPPPPPSPWGPPGHDFERLDELRLVPGMTEPLFEAVLPHAVLHLGQGPLYEVADPVVRAAMDQARRETHTTQADPDPRAGGLVEIRAHAVLGGYAFSRDAKIWVAGTLGNSVARFRVLEWK